MSDRCYVGTRKGLFVLERAAPRGTARSGGNGWRVARTAFLGDPVTMVLPDAREGTLYAALNLGHFGVKLHRSADDGASWEEVAAPAYPMAPQGAAEAPSVDLIWTLEAGGPEEPGVLWAGTIPGGLFRSADGGRSWTLNEPLWNVPGRTEWMGGGYPNPGIHSICVHPRDARHLTVGVSSGGVWTSTDGGGSWVPRTRGMFAVYAPPEQREAPQFQDPHRVVACPARPETLWTQHHNGVFRSTDGGERWEEITVPPSSFGFAVAVHPREPDTAWFVPAVKDEQRIPVDGRLVVARTRDGGRSFEGLSEGLPPAPAYDLIYRHGLAVHPGGETLAMGSTTGALWHTEDGGDAWALFSAHLPPIYCVRFAP